MSFYGYHGVYPEELKLGQRFIVDIVVDISLKKAGETDSLEYTVNYAELYEKCRQIVEGKPYKLVEAVAEKIAGSLLSNFPQIKTCTIKVIKPDPPIPGHYQSVAVEIMRGRV
jgi:dihydroneopterin aldolase